MDARITGIAREAIVPDNPIALGLTNTLNNGTSTPGHVLGKSGFAGSFSSSSVIA